jgi:cytochrome d ubiquinol oxidase subunit I
VYAVGMLRGRRDRYHRIGLIIPLTVAAVATPIQLFVGDTAARAVADDQPAKFAAMEYVTETGTHQPSYVGGVLIGGDVKGAIEIPDLDSIFVGFSADTEVTGLDRIPDDREAPAPTLIHLAFDAMVGIGSALLLLGIWFAVVWWRRRELPRSVWFLRASAVSGVAAVVALECGWIVTEVGRQPWIVYGQMRTSEAVTTAGGIWFTLAGSIALYAVLGTATVLVLRGMSRRWREQEEIDERDVPYGPPEAVP